MQDRFTDGGQRQGDVFFHRQGGKFRDSGQGVYFADVDREEAGFKLDMGPQARPRPGAPSPPVDLSSLDYVRKIIEFCGANSIGLRVFITPAHAHQNEISAAVGEWSKIGAGKRALVKMLAQDAERTGAEPFPLWDFSGYSSVTTESVPSPGEWREMTNYWDSSHFTEIVGDWVMERLFGTANSMNLAPVDFGVRLTEATIETELEMVRADRDEYRRSHSDEVEALKAMVMEVYRKIPPERRVQIDGVR